VLSAKSGDQIGMATQAQTVLVTGGAGYIGSHTCKVLAQKGFVPVTFDNLSTGHAHSVQWGPLVKGELADTDLLQRTIGEHNPIAVIHFAAMSLVGESVADPGKYYEGNVAGTLSLLKAMRDTKLDKIVFSSTAATYGVPETIPIPEHTPTVPINPYGRTKLIIEGMLKDFEAAHGIRHIALRYFNACGADPDGAIGEEHEPETHLIPNALRAIAGQMPEFKLFGDDYDTPDGTCIRDYIHVMDLADGHVRAVSHLTSGGQSDVINLGTGQGYSVKEILEATKRVTNRPLPLSIVARRPGDPPVLSADVTKAREVLGFETQCSDLDTIVRTAWNYHSARWNKDTAA
jgi:UDP-arabinose 4-epimerase